MFRWTLYDIDETDIESLIPFVFEYPRWKSRRKRTEQDQELYADDVNWL